MKYSEGAMTASTKQRSRRVISIVAIGLSALPATLAGLAGASLLGWIAWRKIGGQTGDILGASQQITEILAGLTLLILAM